MEMSEKLVFDGQSSNVHTNARCYDSKTTKLEKKSKEKSYGTTFGVDESEKPKLLHIQ